ncbi:DUF1883 domain-containing protein, partial [Acinetobacter bereziniae]
MNFIQYDLGSRKSGEVIEVTLTAAANVRLMQSSDFNNYKNGRRHSYRGGLVTRSPYLIAIPSSGRWYLTVDMQGLRGRVILPFLIDFISRKAKSLSLFKFRW